MIIYQHPLYVAEGQGERNTVKKIVAQLSPNNQLRVRYSRRHSSLKGKSGSDLTREKETARIALHVATATGVNSLLSASSSESVHMNSVFPDGGLFPSYPLSLEKLIENSAIAAPLPLLKTDIPTTVTYADTTKDGAVVETAPVEQLLAQKRLALDIIQKSQHANKRTRTWGSVQSVKRFTSAAKQKILEAGAVVERQTKLEEQYELTLTIPGSGFRVYDVVSRWSGYLVNRLTQIIRRWQQKGIEVYWFFVWEHQKRGALHSHWCLAVPGSPEKTEELGTLLKDKWFSLLHELSAKEGVDLFSRPGFQGSWKDSPSVWQWSLNPVRKSVAAYFSKYCSKNSKTSKHFEKSRSRASESEDDTKRNKRIDRLSQLCPSRYWGASTSIKRLCKQLTVTIEITPDSLEEAVLIKDFLFEIADGIASEVSHVSRNFLVKDETTDFVYCEGWEEKAWYPKSLYDALYLVFSRLRIHAMRKSDPLGMCMDALLMF